MVLRGRNRNAGRARNWERLACPRVEVPTAGYLGVARQAFLDWERKLARLGHIFGTHRFAKSVWPRLVQDLRRLQIGTDADPAKAPSPTPSQPSHPPSGARLADGSTRWSPSCFWLLQATRLRMMEHGLCAWSHTLRLAQATRPNHHPPLLHARRRRGKRGCGIGVRCVGQRRELAGVRL